MENPVVSAGGTGRSRRVLVGVRLDADVAAGLRQIAQQSHIPASTLARSYVTRQITTELARQQRTTDDALLVQN